MARDNNDLGMDHEAVDQISKELTEFAHALAAMRAYAHADDGLTADKFGVLGQRTGVGQTYTRLRDSLRDVLDKATPVVDAMSQALAYAQKQTAEVDSRVASDISKADRTR